MVRYRITRAKETLIEAKKMFELEFYNTCINRLYYSCFYAVNALLVNNNIIATSHNGVRQMFGLHFVKSGKISKENGKLFSDLFDNRQKGDYVDFIKYSKDTVLEFIKPVENFIKSIEKLLQK
ncbi:MAG: HEPN domain-containing protein [Candidatus Cloacimonetes bacterium]|nr:HEPN domain-containing protein [Candidatus Cloacimonadota bacterium]